METNSNLTLPGSQAAGDENRSRLFEQIKEHMKVDARNRGARNMPPLNQRRYTDWFEEHHLPFQQLLDENARDIPLNAIVDKVAEHKKHTDTKLLALENELHDVQHKQIATDSAVKGMRSPYSHLRIVVVWAVVIGIMQCDGMLSQPVWQAFELSLILCVWIGVLYAVALSVLSYYFEKLVRMGNTAPQRWLIGLGILSFVTIIFCFMAAHRAAYHDQQLEQSGVYDVHVPPTLFVFLSLLFFCGSIIIKYFAYPKQHQRALKQAFDAALQEKRENDDHYIRLCAEKDAILHAHALVRNAAAEKLARGAANESLIISHAAEAYARFKAYNEEARPDRGRPLSFDEPYPHTFKTYFDAINKL